MAIVCDVTVVREVAIVGAVLIDVGVKWAYIAVGYS
jgi:hypothetical protein